MALNAADQLLEQIDLNKVAEAVVSQVMSVEQLARVWESADPAIVKLVKTLIGAVIGSAATAGAVFAEALVDGETLAQPAFDRLARVALKDITGIDANIGPSLGGGAGRKDAARSLGAGILQALSGISGAGPSGSGQLEPSTKAAEDYLSFVVGMSLEGWLTGLAGEFATLGAIENLGDLDDALANSLGLARTSRAVMRPFIQTTVATPATWAINKTYRPELLTPALAARMFTRGRWTREQLNEELARQGWSDDRIEALLADAERRPSLGVVLRAVENEYIEPAEAKAYLLDEGYTDQIADWLLQFEEFDRIAKFQQELADAAAAAYVARRIEAADFNRLIGEAGVPAKQRARIRELAELKRALNRKSLSESDAEEAVKRNVISIPEWRRVLQEAGYDDDAVRVKELLLQVELRDARAVERAKETRAAELAAEQERKRLEAEAKKAALDAERAVTEPSIGQVERLVTRGIWSFADYEAFLVAERYNSATVAGLVESIQQDRLDYLAKAAARAAAAERGTAKAITLGELERAVLLDLASLDDYRRRLVAEGYSAADVSLLTASLRERIADQEELERRRREVADRQPDKGLSLSQAETAVLRGVMTLADFDALLVEQGYSAFDRAVMVELLQRRQSDQAAAEQQRLEQEAAAAAKSIPLADIRRAVLKGIRSLDDYDAALMEARIAGADRSLMLDLLRAELAELADAQARRQELAETQPTRGVSLTQLEQAVVVGAATLEQYQAELAAAGYSADDIDLLTALLLDRITETQRARTRRTELVQADPARALPIGQLEKAVRAGVRSLADYENGLAAAGYTSADAAALVLLLGIEIAEASDARARRAAIVDEVAQTGVFLAATARAVRLGEAPIERYVQQLRDAGYPASDVSTLTALLEREISEEAAAVARRGELAADNQARALSLSQFEKAVRGGVRTLEEYTAFLVDQGYGLEDQATLAELLRQQLDKAAGAKDAGEEA